MLRQPTYAFSEHFHNKTETLDQSFRNKKRTF